MFYLLYLLAGQETASNLHDALAELAGPGLDPVEGGGVDGLVVD